jgi:signal transduction histidine kinase
LLGLSISRTIIEAHGANLAMISFTPVRR